MMIDFKTPGGSVKKPSSVLIIPTRCRFPPRFDPGLMMVSGFVKFRAFSFVGLVGFAELFLKRKLSFPVSRM